MPFNLGLKKKKRPSSDSISTFNSKKSSSRNSKRPISVQSTPGNYRSNNSISDINHSPYNGGANPSEQGQRKDVGNLTEPSYSLEIPLVSQVANEDDDLLDSNSAINAIDSSKGKHLHLSHPHSLKRKQSSTNPSFSSGLRRSLEEGEQQSQNDNSGHRSSGQVSQKGDTVSLGSSSNHSSKRQHPSSSHQVEEHMANVESTDYSSKNTSGFFSSLVHAAQNAANQLITSQNADDIKSHPPKQSSPENESSFMQHLDTLLHKEHSDKKTTLDTQNDDIVLEREPSPSLAHDVQFKPLRETLLSTLGKGELKLEDFGLDDAPRSINGNGRPINQDRPLSVQTNSVPRISISEDTEDAEDTTTAANGDYFSREPTEGTQVEDTTRSNIPPTTSYDSNASTIGSTSTPNAAKTIDIRTGSPTNSPRRSLSPGGVRQGTAKLANLDGSLKKIHRKSVGSTNGESSINGIPTPSKNNVGVDITPESSMNNSSTDLKNITFASTKRNNEFHSLFKSISKSERLIDEYKCALQKEILVQGKIYVSEYHLSFKSNILGWVTNLTIPIQEVVQVEKKTTAGLFHNAIVIQTLHQKYVFASFLQRDTTFELIVGIWSQLVRGSLPKDDNVNVNLQLDDLSRQQSYDSYDSDEYDDSYESDEYESDEDANDLESLDENAPMKHEPTEPDHKENSNETKITEAFIDAPLPKIYQFLFGDDTSTLKDILQKQKNSDISTLTGFKEENGVKQRHYEYTKPLNGSVGPKSTLCKVTETLEHYDPNDYVKVTQSSTTPDVPSGNSFVVKTLIFLSWGPNNSTKISVYSSIEWSSKSWIKAAVEKGTISGQNESIGILVDELTKASKSTSSSDKVASDEESSGEETALPTVGPKTHSPTSIDHELKSSETLIVDEVLSAPLGTIYSILFGDDTSYMKSIASAQGNVKISDIPTFKSEKSIKKRTYDYTKPLSGPIGPKETKCFVTETIEHFDLDKYIQVTQSTSSPDVPSGNSFTVATSIYLSWAENNATRLYVLTEILWSGRSWIKGAIEKGTIDGQKESLGVLLTEVRNILKNATVGKKKRRRAKTRTESGVFKKQAEEVKAEAPQKATEISVQGLVDLVMTQLKNPLSAIGLLCLLFLAFYLTYKIGSFIFREPTHNITIDRVSKVDINGQKFMLIPSFDDLIQNDEARYKAEFDIWDWIDDKRTKSNDFNDDRMSVRPKTHSDQDLAEILRLAEQHWEALKQQIDDDHETSE